MAARLLVIGRGRGPTVDGIADGVKGTDAHIGLAILP